MIATDRLDLVPATADLARAALAGPRALEGALGAEVPATWPPEYNDAKSFQFTVDQLPVGLRLGEHLAGETLGNGMGLRVLTYLYVNSSQIKRHCLRFAPLLG